MRDYAEKNQYILTIVLLVLSFMLTITTVNAQDQQAIDMKAIDAKVAQLVESMTLAEKIGQITQVDKRYLKKPSHIKRYYLGSILSGGGSVPDVNQPAAWADMYDEYQAQALQTRLKIPLIYGIDAVHGHNNVVGAVIFPHNIGLGCTNNPDLVRQAAVITAKEVYATGINWTFSPCVAVPRDERWGRTYEGFSESPDIVKVLGKASVEGYQGAALSDAHTVVACAKHFVGDGGPTWGTGDDEMIDRGDTQVSPEELREIHLPGYIPAIEAGVASVMLSYNSINGNKMHGHSDLVNGLLRNELDFQGIVISDWAGIEEIPGNDKSDIEVGMNAGLDMIMVPEHYQKFIRQLKSLVRSGKVPMSRIDDAVSRILRVKFQLDLFERPYADRSALDEVGSNKHREVARECVRQSVVMLKNDGLLPQSKDLSRIHVTGRFADDVGAQCGGWTISWQGGNGDITPGTSVLDGIRNTVAASTEVTSSADGSGAEGADLAVVVIGENPYAEMVGDRPDLNLAAEDLAAIEQVKASGTPFVVILISGRPMILGTALDQSNAFLAAWLPGTEGQGIVDILFGDYNPTGKLSYSWPRSMDQIPINIGDDDYDPLFELGFGLSY